MKKYYLLLIFLFSFLMGFAQKDSLSLEEQERREKNIQAGNPFKKFGYKPKISTLSQGKYLEFHDLDSVVQIGSFTFHVKKKVITGFIVNETRYSEATLRPEIISRWMSPDPLSDEFPSWSPYTFVHNNPINMIDPDGRAAIPLDDHFINDDGSIQTVLTEDTYDRFYVQDETSETGYRMVAQLEKHEEGLVEFPGSGEGFSRYGTSDAGGKSANEAVGKGDHYLNPETAAALFGVINKLSGEFSFNISFGDMSSSNGSDPWQQGFSHHKGHGHLGARSGMDVDFRYLNKEGTSFQSGNAFKNGTFSSSNNQSLYNAAAIYGFTKNYQGTSGRLSGPSNIPMHNDHGHLGLQYINLNWTYVPKAPIK